MLHFHAPNVRFIEKTPPCLTALRLERLFLRRTKKSTAFAEFCKSIGIFAKRRYSRSASDEQARRASSGVCEPMCLAALWFERLFPSQTKKAPLLRCFVWLGNRDSNPNKQSQSLSCCRYTIPQCFSNGIYCITSFFVCQGVFEKYYKF